MKFLLRVIIAILALLLIVVGVVAAISPIPLGVVMIAVGLIMLSFVAPPVRGFVRWLRRRWKWLDHRLDDAQETLPESIAEPLRESDPPDEEDEDAGEDNDPGTDDVRAPHSTSAAAEKNLWWLNRR